MTLNTTEQAARLETLRTEIQALESDTPQLEGFVEQARDTAKQAKVQRLPYGEQLDLEGRAVAAEHLLEGHLNEIQTLQLELATLEGEHHYSQTLERLQTIADRTACIFQEGHTLMDELAAQYERSARPIFEKVGAMNAEVLALYYEFHALKRQRFGGIKLEDTLDFSYPVSEMINRSYPTGLAGELMTPPRAAVSDRARELYALMGSGEPAFVFRHRGKGFSPESVPDALLSHKG